MILNDLRRASLLYVATPYSKFPGGHEEAFRQAAAITGRLMLRGLRVYSPIAHGHPLSLYGGVPFADHEVWIPFDRAMMEKSDALIVVKMTDWHRSDGVDHEIRFFLNEGRGVYFVNPDTLEFDGDANKTAS